MGCHARETSRAVDVWGYPHLGGTYAGEEFPPEDLPQLMAVILDNNSRSASSVRVLFDTAGDLPVDMTRVKSEYDLSWYGDRLLVSMDDARKIADQA